MPETHPETWMTERTASVHSALQTKWLESRRPRFAPQVTAQQFIALVAIAAAATLAAPPTWHAPNDSWVQAFVVLTIVSIVLEFVSVDLPFDGDLSVATISQVATILLVPAPMAAVGVGLSVLVASVDDLIRMKRASARPKDLVEVEILGALREEIEDQERGRRARRARGGRT